MTFVDSAESSELCVFTENGRKGGGDVEESRVKNSFSTIQ